MTSNQTVAGSRSGQQQVPRIGAVVRGLKPTRAHWVETVKKFDDQGFDIVLVPDHIGVPSPFPLMVSGAYLSDRLRFGAQVLNNEFWNPVLLARDLATSVVVTDGRIELGLGAGHAEQEFAQIGMAYDPPGPRIERLAAAATIVKQLVEGETVTTTDAPYLLTEAALGLPVPSQAVPTMIGGNGDRVLRIAAEQASIVGFTGFTSGNQRVQTELSHFGWDGLVNRIAHVRDCAGERFDELELSALLQAVIITDDPEAAAQEWNARVDPSVATNSPFMLLGSVAEIREQVARLHELGVTYLTVFDNFTDALAGALA